MIAFTEADNNPFIGPLPPSCHTLGGWSWLTKTTSCPYCCVIDSTVLKHPGTFSFGGEDGLEETPVIGNQQGDNLCWESKMGDLFFAGKLSNFRSITPKFCCRKYHRSTLSHLCFRNFGSGKKFYHWGAFDF